MIQNQKSALDKLMDEQYNRIHNDAFNRIFMRQVRKLNKSDKYIERAQSIIWSLWQERKRFRDIMKTQDFEYSKLLKEHEELLKEFYKLRNTKGEYGKA